MANAKSEAYTCLEHLHSNGTLNYLTVNFNMQYENVNEPGQRSLLTRGPPPGRAYDEMCAHTQHIIEQLHERNFVGQILTFLMASRLHRDFAPVGLMVRAANVLLWMPSHSILIKRNACVWRVDVGRWNSCVMFPKS